MSIKNVALNLAFEDYSYFNRLFKKITGITPKNIAPLITLKQKKRNSNFHTIPFFSTRSKRLRYPQLIFIQIKHTFHQLPFFSRRTQIRTVLKFRHILFPPACRGRLDSLSIAISQSKSSGVSIIIKSCDPNI